MASNWCVTVRNTWYHIAEDYNLDPTTVRTYRYNSQIWQS